MGYVSEGGWRPAEQVANLELLWALKYIALQILYFLFNLAFYLMKVSFWWIFLAGKVDGHQQCL